MREIRPTQPPDMGRVPPHDVTLEAIVISGILTNDAALVNILPVLKPEVFYKERYAVICEAVLSLTEDNKPVDIMTVSAKLKAMDKLDEIGGYFALTEIAEQSPNPFHVSEHYRLLMELFFRRKIMNISMLSVTKSTDETIDVFDVYEWLISEYEEIDIHIGAGQHDSSLSVYQDTIKIIENEAENVRFYPIDDKGIDSILMLSPGNFVNISGKSGSGKTSFVTYISRMLLNKYDNVSICWYTMEDEPTKILMSFLSPEIKLTHKEMHGKNYTLSQEEKEFIKHGAKMFARYDIEFFHKPAFVSHIKAHFQRFCAQRPKRFNILIIDNIMLLRDNQAHRFKSKQHEVDDHIATQLQSIFTNTKADYDINVWFLHHLTKDQLRNTNFAEGYRPKEDNIRGSTRYRDMVTQGILINRPGEFNDIVSHYKETAYYKPIQNLMICEVFKNRNGETGFMRYFVDLGYKVFFPI
jgi:replicative DNA helicase